MNVVDSSGWVEYFANSSRSHYFKKPLIETSTLVVPVICIYEVYKLVRNRMGKALAEKAIRVMENGTVASFTSAMAVQAAEVAIQHKLAMADAAIYQTAQLYQATLWTQDADLKGLPGVKYFPKGG